MVLIVNLYHCEIKNFHYYYYSSTLPHCLKWSRQHWKRTEELWIYSAANQKVKDKVSKISRAKRSHWCWNKSPKFVQLPIRWRSKLRSSCLASTLKQKMSLRRTWWRYRSSGTFLKVFSLSLSDLRQSPTQPPPGSFVTRLVTSKTLPYTSAISHLQWGKYNFGQNLRSLYLPQ